MVAPLFVGRTKSVNALADAMNKDKLVFLSTQKRASVDNPGETDINRLGTIGKVLQLLRLPDGTVKALVEGKARARIKKFSQAEGFFSRSKSKGLQETVVPEAEADGAYPIGYQRIRRICQYQQKYFQGTGYQCLLHCRCLTVSRHGGGSHFSFKIEDKQKLLESLNPAERLSLLLNLVKMEIEVFRMDQRIKNRVKEQMEQTLRKIII